MAFFHALSIRSKVTLVTLATCMLALVVSSLVLFAFKLEQFRRRFTQDLVSLSRVTAHNSSAALAFQDEKTAQELLDGLKPVPHIIGARIEARDGSVFAEFGASEEFSAHRQRSDQSGRVFEGNHLVLFEPIRVADLVIGTLFVRADYGQAYRQLSSFSAAVFAVVVLVSALIALLVSRRLQEVITRPVLSLAEAARQVAANQDYSIRAQKTSEDELGTLTDSFNQMLDQIQRQDAALRREIAERLRAEEEVRKMQGQLMEASREAGKAEVATDVLHNVGNVLNSVNISTTLIAEALRRSKLDNLVRATALLNAPPDPTPEAAERRRLLPRYLSELSLELSQFHEKMAHEARALEKNVGHIRDVINMQQGFARAAAVTEVVRIEEILDDAIALNAGAFREHGIEIVRPSGTFPTLTVDRHKVLQILVNLLQNARYAVKAAGVPHPRIEIVVETVASARLRISVKDNGIGIAPENLQRIFAHGFTTRPGGHGFGLHSSAIAAHEIGGTLTATSEGPGRGSTFTLELPLAPEKASAA